MTYYQVVNIGTAYTTTSLDIGLDDDRISIVSEDSIDKSLPTVYLYWGKSSGTKTYQGSLNLRELAADNMIIPVIDDSTDFMKSIPDELARINALIIKSGNYAIVGNWILKHFGLYEATNKVFISYRRSDTSMLAHQLFERLIEAGYTPFLDCYSIESGVDFQEYLRNEIVDADVFVYLNSPHYNESPYTIEERDCAQKLSLGIVQVTFNEVSTDISVMNSSNIALGLDANPIFIYNSDVIDRILVEIEKKRAVMFEYRRKALVNSYRLLNERDCLCIRADETIYNVSKGELLKPVCHVPTAVDFHSTDKQFKHDKQHKKILFDSQFIRRDILDHIKWLDRSLPVNICDINS